ncbi:hypothetical protein JYQ62_09905 [Nostoc sp. UHCC 0702]|nr:hypothetical protein JYQ62_09905 [Nostoc sp. UHCC 0702]
MKQFFISWVPFQRRSISLQTYFGYNLKFLTLSFKYRFLRPIEYILKAWQTLRLFFQHQPQIIWVQLTPTPLLHVAHFYKKVFQPKTIIIADCHNNTFDSPWINIPGAVYLLKHSDLVIVHNDWVNKKVIEDNLSNGNICVLEDPPVVIKSQDNKSKTSFSHPLIVFPCSFNVDEPIQDVLESARLAPNITFVLTGNTARARGIHDFSDVPDNVKLPGFLPEEEFNQLLLDADAILGLTKEEGIQLSVAVEGVGIGKPLILSDTVTLRKLFDKGAIYVKNNSPSSIAEGCIKAISRQEELIQEIQELQRERAKIWLDQMQSLETILQTKLRNTLAKN